MYSYAPRTRNCGIQLVVRSFQFLYLYEEFVPNIFFDEALKGYSRTLNTLNSREYVRFNCTVLYVDIFIPYSKCSIQICIMGQIATIRICTMRIFESPPPICPHLNVTDKLDACISCYQVCSLDWTLLELIDNSRGSSYTLQTAYCALELLTPNQIERDPLQIRRALRFVDTSSSSRREL